MDKNDTRKLLQELRACGPEYDYVISTADGCYLETKKPEFEAFIRDFLTMARENDIAGVFYWEPLWLPGEGICWASEAGQAYIREEGKSTTNEWANQCLFDYEGRKLPAFESFAQSK